MATYASLTADQQATVQSWLNLQRAWASAQAKANDLGAAVDTAYNAQITPLGLGSAEAIPNTSGLDGAQAMVFSDAVTIESHIQSLQSTTNDTAHRGLWVKACGAANL